MKGTITIAEVSSGTKRTAKSASCQAPPILRFVVSEPRQACGREDTGGLAG